MTKIVAHRGAAGLALENTAASFRLAKKIGVDAIEFDVRLTKDHQLIVMHDNSTWRLSSTKLIIKEHTFDELRAVTLKNGEHILSLDQALDIIGNTPVIIEPKDTNSVNALVEVLQRHPQAVPLFVSFHVRELRALKQHLPQARVFAADHLGPLRVIERARVVKADGIVLNKWLLNPLTYWLARYYKLEVGIYVVNNTLLARLIVLLYPKVTILTDRPDRLQPLRSSTS